jgi:RluA family pseudouridine synthase
MTLTVLHEDASLIAFDKPSGLASIRERGDEDGSLHALASARSGGKLFIVHRLDKDTSGVILFAKDPAAHRRLNALFETRQVEKVYLAWVLGSPERDAGVVNAPLREFGSGRVGVDPAGKPATTRWTVLRREEGKTLVEARPETGRRHQIRVHLYSLGHPVLGDKTYGQPRPVGGAPRLLLHAREISFPWEGPEPLRLRAELPADFHPSSP